MLARITNAIDRREAILLPFICETLNQSPVDGGFPLILTENENLLRARVDLKRMCPSVGIVDSGECMEIMDLYGKKRAQYRLSPTHDVGRGECELATIHAERGGNLVIVARSKESLDNLKQNLEKEYPVSVHVIVKDLSLPQAPKEIYEEVKEKGISIDFLINDAGFGGQGEFFERKWELDLAMINVNILALTALTRLFLPDFVKRNSGRILNVSSTAALTPGPLQAVYHATKAYVTSFSNALAEELSDTMQSVYSYRQP